MQYLVKIREEKQHDEHRAHQVENIDISSKYMH